MEKVRFSCPRCQTVMQTLADKVGGEVGCPQCQHKFRLVDTGPSENQATMDFSDRGSDAPTMPPQNAPAGSSWSQSDSYANASNPSGGWQQPAKFESPPANPYAHNGLSSGLTGQSFACPYCQTTNPPIWRSEVSTIGWIVFAVLLVTTCVFCFVGLFIRNRYRVCSQCRVRLE